MGLYLSESLLWILYGLQLLNQRYYNADNKHLSQAEITLEFQMGRHQLT
jgi:hypothetical protein